MVGGLVPYLIVKQDEAHEPHVGSGDLDLGFSIAVLSEEKYREVSSRLRAFKFEPDKNDTGNKKSQTWHIPGKRITVDFLIGPVAGGPRPGRLQNLEGDFAAIVTEALPLAFIDTLVVPLDGITTANERASKSVRVCGPAAFVAMKAFASISHRPETQKALGFLARDFASANHVGPKRYAAFLRDPENAEYWQDAFGAVQAFLTAVAGGPDAKRDGG